MNEQDVLELRGMEGMVRSCYCGELSVSDAGREVVVAGWVHRRRDHGGLLFVDLRDRTGIVQLVLNPEFAPEAFRRGELLRNEYVIAATGVVSLRPEGRVNPRISTGEIEIVPREIRVLNAAKTPPFYIEENVDADESIRLRYRYLDLRRPDMQRNLLFRHRLVKLIRDFFDANGFVEIETPMLTRSTPEGARDYLVPSRLSPGKFYALPQSPQLFKQLLMVAGFDRYFQIVKCFRDEDLRADRQPEFTQIDVEMSFADREQILSVIERMTAEIFRKMLGVELEIPFPRLSYAECIERFGSDKPDLRFGMELVDISDVAKGCGFKVFREAVEQGGKVKGINVGGCAGYSRKEIDNLAAEAAAFGAGGLAWAAVTAAEVRSPFWKFLAGPERELILERLRAKEGDLLLFVAGDSQAVADSLGCLRVHLGKRLGLADPSRYAFLWVVDFPLLEWDEEAGRYSAVHHPFTSPAEEDIPMLETAPEKVRALAYDLVMNGVELGGGSIRIHRREVQEKMFRALGLSDEEASDKFGFLLEAFEYGTPPHGGIALGLDRLVMLLLGRDTIRDTIAFPKTARATCLMTDAPSDVSPKQLRELHINLRV